MILTQSASIILFHWCWAMQHLYLSHKKPTNRTGFDGAVGLSSPGTWQSGWILDPSETTDVHQKPVGIRMETVNMEAMTQESRWLEHVDFPSLAISYAKYC